MDVSRATRLHPSAAEADVSEVSLSGAERTIRHQRLLGLFDRSHGRGLEIGPLFDPVVRRWEADIRYVDVHTGDRLKEYYSTHPGVPVDEIVDPDFVLIGPDGPRTLPEVVRGADPFDWVIASHVIEHVPDLIGWLAEVAEILEDGGRLVLAVPDRRFSFDADRDPTTVGEMLLARHDQDKIPSVRAIYDHYSRVVTIDAADAWNGAPVGDADRIHDLEFVRSQLALAVDEGTYVDCHVWLFTPQSFVDQLGELARLDTISFVVDRIVPTAQLELEFYAVLRRIPRNLTSSARALRLAGGFDLRGLDEVHTPEPVADTHLGPRVERLSPQELRLIRGKRAVTFRLRAISAKVFRR